MEREPVAEGGDDLALVMSGGGARAAYQVGFLSCLARHFPELRIPIVTGVSAGAINAAYLAARAEPLGVKVERLTEIWRNLRTEQVFEVGAAGIFTRVLRWGISLVSGGRIESHRRGLVDTAPLREFLNGVLDTPDGALPGIVSNLESGRLRAVAITASSYTTGQSVTWVQGREIVDWQRADRQSAKEPLSVEHVMASAALPLFFPAVRVGRAWYGDGGMRLTAPLSPAIHLGARRILAISTRFQPDPDSIPTMAAAEGSYPPPAQVAGVLLNSIFLDQFDGDTLRLERINRLLERIPPDQRGTLSPVKLLVLRPSRDLGRLANEYEASLPRTFRFMTRGLGTRETRSNDLLSLVMFQPDYLSALIDIGERDAYAQRHQIAELLECGTGGRV